LREVSTSFRTRCLLHLLASAVGTDSPPGSAEVHVRQRRNIAQTEVLAGTGKVDPELTSTIPPIAVQQLLERDAEVVIVQGWRRKFIALVSGADRLAYRCTRQTTAMDDRPS
jgi:hypothetical protein